ncbi:MAG TPA: hypothetical protein PLZ36_07745, partial [Armatimonadota bacterium]|nr:hypothetical protein [Armatimonadota bacterium]
PATRIYTPGYAPPEVQQGGPVGPESDIYELGMTLHELLTGALPPPEYARPRSWTPRGVGEPWRSLIARAVAARREDRPRDVRAWWAGQRRGDRRALIGIAEGAMAICTRVSCWWRRGRRHALVGIAAVVLAGAAALLIYQPPRQEPPVSPPTPPAPTATTTVIPPPTPQERPVTHTPSTATTTHPVSRPTTPPASSPTSTRPVAPPASGEATKPAPLGGAPTAAELPGLLGYTNYLVSVGDRLIYGMGVAKDRRAAEVMAKRHLLAGLRTLPGRAGAGPDALHGAQRNQEIRLADGGYCLIYILPIPAGERE